MRLHSLTLALIAAGQGSRWTLPEREQVKAHVEEIASHAARVQSDFAALPKPPRPWERPKQEPGRSRYF